MVEEFYPANSGVGTIRQGDQYDQEPTTHRSQTGFQIRKSSEENAETEGEGQEDRQEEMTQHPGWFLIIAGLIIVGVGIIWLLAPSIPWLGKLPGDIRIERENVRFYFPVVTCIVVSVLLTGIIWLVRFFSK